MDTYYAHYAIRNGKTYDYEHFTEEIRADGIINLRKRVAKEVLAILKKPHFSCEVTITSRPSSDYVGAISGYRNRFDGTPIMEWEFLDDGGYPIENVIYDLNPRTGKLGKKQIYLR